MKPLKALVTSGPTQEPLDPVRYLTNDSSGKQGHAIASALANLGVEVTLISGPVHLPKPKGVSIIHVRTALEMLAACTHHLNGMDMAVCAAAVSDWRPKHPSRQKLKKQNGVEELTLTLIKNPDILATISQHKTSRPPLVVGFAAETENVLANAVEKRKRKGCDWIIANDVSKGIFGAEENTVHLITEQGVEDWPRMKKVEIARKLAQQMQAYVSKPPSISRQ